MSWHYQKSRKIIHKLLKINIHIHKKKILGHLVASSSSLLNFHVQKTLISILKLPTDYLNKNNIYYIKTRTSIVDFSTALITDNRCKTILFEIQ